MRVTGRRFALIGTSLLAGGALSCAAIWGFQDLKPPSQDGGVDGEAGAVDAGDERFVCNGEHPPSAPDGAITTDMGSFVMAIDTIDIGVPRDGGVLPPTRAYDLDGVCTCAAPDQESCVRPKNKAPDPTCDDDRGRDDSGRTLLSKLRGFLTTDNLTTENATFHLSKADMGVLIGVQDYNGEPDDPDVSVFVVPSFGLPSGAVMNGLLPRNGVKAPTWSTADKWSYDPRFGNKIADDHLVGPLASSRAYVANGLVVAYFSDVVIHLQVDVTNSNPIPIHITDAVITSTIVPSGNAFELRNGRMSGRWIAADLLRAAGAWDLTSSGLGPLCPSNTVLFQTFQTIACPGRDINGRALDPASQPCNAISFSLGFSAKPASVGEPAGYPYATTPCFDGGLDLNPDAGYPAYCP